MSNQVEKERGNTDESLREEREKTDQALVDRQAVADENADETVDKARSVADAVVATARVRVDNLRHAGRDEKGLPSLALAEQRTAEDDAQQRARAGADAATRTHAKKMRAFSRHCSGWRDKRPTDTCLKSVLERMTRSRIATTS